MTRNKPDKPRSDRKHTQQHDALKAVAASMDPVADASIDSFPASDPPSWWAGPAR